MFCIDCQSPQGAFCYYCRSSHDCSHRIIQIRRSSYQNVVRISELMEIIDISDIQTYVINGARVVFLNERPQLRGNGIFVIKSSSSPSYRCEICSRVLLGAFRYCSLGCNVAGIERDNDTIVSEDDTDCSGKDVETIVVENDINYNGKDVETIVTENDTVNNGKDVETGDAPRAPGRLLARAIPDDLRLALRSYAAGGDFGTAGRLLDVASRPASPLLYSALIRAHARRLDLPAALALVARMRALRHRAWRPHLRLRPPRLR
ncbi:hypothetical protein GUJ93_ZPchr0001g31420 [Zizania palustris]|uniref:Uncharacterized protein n=1 Tax=Zizania palustris TaxID=103762 RepID=A0A8J5RMT2_ZIZPA|nr:hypothetical protein GUJ93_ZPchr0001g31420 [Zizania palustris]